MDALVLADLAATCNNIGYHDTDSSKYVCDVDCLECIKELIRFLRNDDDVYQIRKALGDSKIVQNDLIPIVKYHAQSDVELFDYTLRLLVNLTTPLFVLFEDEMPTGQESKRIYLEILKDLQEYKRAFCDAQFWSSLLVNFTSCLHKDWHRRVQDDNLLIERVLILIRNVLQVPLDAGTEKRTDNDVTVHDQIIWALHLTDFECLLIYIAQSDSERNLCLHILEIMYLMLHEQSPRQLVMSDAARSLAERGKDTEALSSLRLREARSSAARMVTRNKNRFAGTFSVENLASISDRHLICHRLLTDTNEIMARQTNKVAKKIPRNRQPLPDEGVSRRSMLSIRLVFRQLCVECLNGAYNPLMSRVKDILNRAKSQTHDEYYYFWAIHFFLDFNRHNCFNVACISETLSIAVFHHIQSQMDVYLEMLRIEKHKVPVWSRRARMALRAYQSLLLTIDFMSKSTKYAASARVIQANLFYMPEYRELLHLLLTKHTPSLMSRSFLSELVECTHVFLKLMDAYFKKNKHCLIRKRGVSMEKEEEEENIDNEVDYSYGEFVKKFCSSRVLEPYCHLLKSFDVNSAQTNHCILRMFHRVAFELNSTGLLYQASLFRTFQRLLLDDQYFHDPTLQQLICLAKHILRCFFKHAKSNKLIFAECLFWKTERDVYDIENGYGSYSTRSRPSSKFMWSAEEEDELQRLYDEYKKHLTYDKDSDVVDFILKNLINQDRTRRMVIRKLKTMQIVNDLREIKSVRGRGSTSAVWTDSEAQQLKDLWIRFESSSTDPIKSIKDGLGTRRSKKQIRDKLSQLGFDVKSRRKSNKSKHAGSAGESLQTVDDDPSLPHSDTLSFTSEDDTPAADISDIYAEEQQAGSVNGRDVGQIVADIAAQLKSNGTMPGTREAVHWLCTSLDDCVEARQHGYTECVCLVPTTASLSEWMCSRAAVQLLTACGVYKQDKHDLYWKWPASYTCDTFKRILDTLSGSAHLAHGTQTVNIDIEMSASDTPTTVSQATPSTFSQTTPTIVSQATPSIVSQATPSTFSQATPCTFSQATRSTALQATPSTVSQTTPTITTTKGSAQYTGNDNDRKLVVQEEERLSQSSFRQRERGRKRILRARAVSDTSSEDDGRAALSVADDESSDPEEDSQPMIRARKRVFVYNSDSSE